MAAPSIVILNDANFEAEVTKSTLPVFVDFWAEWCGPCKMLGPTFDELATEYDGRVKFAKVDIDSNERLATECGIRAVPTLLLYKGGAVQSQLVGYKSKRDLKQALDQVLA